MQRYTPIAKMESQSDGTIKVWGIASTEEEDNDGEVIKADAMKAALPGYMEFGAIREMHQPIAAGTCLEAAVNAEGQTIICAHVVDPSSVLKVKTGVLKGFSIGGTADSTDPLNKKVITQVTLNEISLVDKPANPDALISLWKAEKHAMTTKQTPAAISAEQFGNEIETLYKAGDISLDEMMAAVKKAVILKKKSVIDKKVECMHGIELGDKCDSCGGFAKADMDGDVDEFMKTDYTDEQRATMATNGEAEEDGSYPIKNEKDLENAIHAYGRSKNKAKTKKHIIARAKALGLESKLPEKWTDGNESGSGEDTKKAAAAPAGGTNDPVGNESETTKAAKSGNGAAVLEKTQANAEVPPVGPSTHGAPNADNMQPPAGVAKTDGQADTPMLEKPAVGDIVSIKWGEDEISGEIKELGDGNSVTIQNGEALMAVDSSKLVHNEMLGTKRNWTINVADNADFLAVKPGDEGGKGASKADVSARISAALDKACANGAGRKLQKGMWTVSDWAGQLQSIVWLYKDIQWEGQSEEDAKDGEIANKVAAWLKAGAEIWLEYAKDELGEMMSGVADPDNLEAYVIEMAAQPGDLRKSLQPNGIGRAIAKAIGNHQPDVAAAIEKAVGSAVEKAVAPYAAEATELKKRIKELEEMPMPMQGRLNGVAINKGEGTGEEDTTVAPVIGRDGKQDAAATEFKKAFNNPQQLHRITK